MPVAVAQQNRPCTEQLGIPSKVQSKCSVNWVSGKTMNFQDILGKELGCDVED